MAFDLRELVAPGRTALVSNELQNGVIGASSPLQALAEAGERIVPNVARLARAARASGIPVVHGVAIRRPDALGANHNARLFQYMAKAKTQLLEGTEAAELVPGLGAEAGDLRMTRLHGLSPFQGTELDFVLRNQAVRTIVATGVSVNVAIQNLTFDAVNAGYQVVIPRDAVAGFPEEYVDAVFENTLGAIATLTSTEELIAAWQTGAA